MNKKDLKQVTVDTYNKSARELAEYFYDFGIDVYREYIDEIFKILNKKNPKVLEIGCGDGRDAEYIIQKTNNYTGLDISEEMIKLARAKKILAKFLVADIEEYKFQGKYNIIFAFGSLLHSDKQNLENIFKKIAKTGLQRDGILFISLKSASSYEFIVKNDQFGRRIFYFYPIGLIRKMTRKYYQEIYYKRKKIRETIWLKIGLQKR